jgi:hypothetical protein
MSLEFRVLLRYVLIPRCCLLLFQSRASNHSVSVVKFKQRRSFVQLVQQEGERGFPSVLESVCRTYGRTQKGGFACARRIGSLFVLNFEWTRFSRTYWARENQVHSD